MIRNVWRARFVRLFSAAPLMIACSLSSSASADDYQYKFESITIPKASADEPKLAQVSVERAHQYLEQGSVAWSGEKKCVSCHTNGTYMMIRPSLSPSLGLPPEETREFFISALSKLQEEKPERLKQATRPAQVIYIAAGLAEWDAHVTKTLSTETEKALELMFAIQNENGTWGSLDCWPPFESDAYHEATVAAMAAGTAPGWLQKTSMSANESLKSAVGRLTNYLQTEKPAHDYSRVLLLWANARFPELLPSPQKQELVEVLLKHQRDDGGWSIRSFAAPEAWGGGNRAEKLKSEPEFADPPSDGHMTGLALIVLRESGLDAGDARITKGTTWLKSNQQESGRWWTRSLNTDSWHYITYSGTAYPLLALQMCNLLPAKSLAQSTGR
jgi:squalene-hopene/tetraprenyl-beta-curcumene cyclase